MKPMPGPVADFRRRLVGLYALTLMERNGPLHGYLLSEAISQRTEGAWRPGPGSVYPSLQKLVTDGLARSKAEGRRRTYTLTHKGRTFLRMFRARSQHFPQGRHDAMLLWAEILGSKDMGEFVMRRLKRVLDSTESFLANGSTSEPAIKELRKHVRAELSLSLYRLSKMGSPGKGNGRGRARGVKSAG